VNLGMISVVGLLESAKKRGQVDFWNRVGLGKERRDGGRYILSGNW